MLGKMQFDFQLIKHNIHFRESINHRRFWYACMAEATAMFFFVACCCSCAMVTLNLPNPNLMNIASSFGFAILVVAQLIGPISGGHCNCAVSFALFLSGRVSFIRFVFYTLFQMVGSIFGALCVWSIFGQGRWDVWQLGSNSWDEELFEGGQVFFAEMLGTALLVLTVLRTIDTPEGVERSLGCFPIAMSVLIAHLFLLPIDGCSINPTRSFGPSLVAEMAGMVGRYQHQQYMFWIAPMCGAAAAAVFYEYCLFLKPVLPKKKKRVVTEEVEEEEDNIVNAMHSNGDAEGDQEMVECDV